MCNQHLPQIYPYPFFGIIESEMNKEDRKDATLRIPFHRLCMSKNTKTNMAENGKTQHSCPRRCIKTQIDKG